MNKRRKLVIALGAFAASFHSVAQQLGKVWRISYWRESEQSVQYLDTFKAAMRELGYAEGRDYAIEQRSSQNDIARLPALAAEFCVGHSAGDGRAQCDP